MKFLVFLAVALVAICLIDFAYGDCLSTGEECTYTGSLGNCCSGYCDQDISEDKGVCTFGIVWAFVTNKYMEEGAKNIPNTVRAATRDSKLKLQINLNKYEKGTNFRSDCEIVQFQLGN
ncbi:hypothetical protein GE061_005581 [Apolygus lucorum]|uniref:Uncharacterized protein n=1 Tax=Apolygus lucorum TaxID=248454 RepID=A0A8S9WY22_APOLU|nr:hypothetical protein GE061_005581 [Apolygus lucorum]